MWQISHSPANVAVIFHATKLKLVLGINSGLNGKLCVCLDWLGFLKFLFPVIEILLTPVWSTVPDCQHERSEGWQKGLR